MTLQKRIFAFFIIFALVFTLIPQTANAATTLFAPSRVFMEVNTYGKLPLYSTTPQDVYSLPISYKSSDITIATIDSTGTVSGYKKGIVTITIKYRKQTLKIEVFVGDKMMSYTDTSTYFINYPTNWKIDDSKMRTDGVVQFTSPQYDRWMEIFVVEKMDTGVPSSIKNNERYAKNYLENRLKDLPDFELWDTHTEYYKNGSGISYEYTYKDGENTYRCLESIAYNEENVYRLTYLSIKKYYYLYYIEASNMFATFKFI